MDFPLPVRFYMIAASPIEWLNLRNIGTAFEILLISCLEADMIDLLSGVVFDPNGVKCNNKTAVVSGLILLNSRVVQISRSIIDHAMG